MNSETTTLLTNLALELNAAIRAVKNLQNQIQSINEFIDTQGLRTDFLALAQNHNCLELLENNKIQKFQRRMNVSKK